MKKKFLSESYLRRVKEADIKYLFENDYVGAIKKIKEMKEPFISYTGFTLLEKDYYIIEILPKGKHYGVRAFLDNNKNLLEYYIDINYENGVENNIPFYIDLYTDIMIIDGKVNVVDEDELEEALLSNDITKEQYDLAYKTKDELLNEIYNKTNKYINMDFKSMCD